MHRKHNCANFHAKFLSETFLGQKLFSDLHKKNSSDLLASASKRFEGFENKFRPRISSMAGAAA
jgi:hypothetical protein